MAEEKEKSMFKGVDKAKTKEAREHQALAKKNQYLQNMKRMGRAKTMEFKRSEEGCFNEISRDRKVFLI